MKTHPHHLCYRWSRSVESRVEEGGRQHWQAPTTEQGQGVPWLILGVFLNKLLKYVSACSFWKNNRLSNFSSKWFNLNKMVNWCPFKTNSYCKIAAIPLTQCRVIIFLALVWNNSFVENFRSKSSVRYSHLNCSCVATFGHQGDRLLAANGVILNVVLPPTTTFGGERKRHLTLKSDPQPWTIYIAFRQI